MRAVHTIQRPENLPYCLRCAPHDCVPMLVHLALCDVLNHAGQPLLACGRKALHVWCSVKSMQHQMACMKEVSWQ